MTTTLYRLSLTFRADGAVDAVFIRKGRARRRHEIRARFDEYGWRQWGEVRDILADNVCTMTRIRAILDEKDAS